MSPRTRATLETLGPRTERALVAFARDNAALLAVTMSFAVLAYGYALIAPALNLDEQIAPTFGTLGQVNSWNLALYRWGIVAFDFAVLAPANLHVLRPVLALALLSVAAVVFARLLPASRAARAFFCITFVTVPTFAHAMAFSFQSVEYALMILLFVLGLRSLVASTSATPDDQTDGARVVRRAAPGREPTGRARFVTAVLLWVLAQSFYQDYGVLLAATLVWALFTVAADDRSAMPRRLAAFGAAVAASVALDLLVARTLVWLARVPPQAYLTNQLGEATIAHRIVGLLRGTVNLYFGGRAPGGLSLGAAAIALPVLAGTVPGSPRRRAGLVVLAAAACFAPVAYGLGAIPPLRATSGLLFVVAGAAALAVARSPQPIAFFVKCTLLYLVLQNCVAVNDVFHHESLAWAADRAMAIELAGRIHEVAPDVHDDGAVRVLFVGSYHRRLRSEPPGNETFVGAFDTWDRNKTGRRQRSLNEAGFPVFRLATEDDYRAALPLIERMPAWPDRRAVAREGDVVIVKLGPANGFEDL